MVNYLATAAKEGDCLASPAKDDDCPATAGNCLATGAKDSGCPATAAKEGGEYMDGDGWSFGTFWVLPSKDSCSTDLEGSTATATAMNLTAMERLTATLTSMEGSTTTAKAIERQNIVRLIL